MFHNITPWVDEEYINRIGYRLDRFKKVKTGLYNCRCPICGDSKRREDLSRGYFMQDGISWHYYCHNCGVSLSVYSLLKSVDPSIADEYSLSIYKNKYSSSPKKKSSELTKADIPKSEIPIFKERPTGDIISALDLPDDHPVRRYISGRQIPVSCLSRLFYVKKFREWDAKLLDKKYSNKIPDHPRLVIPYYWYDKSIFRYSSRAFGQEIPRYQQTVIDPDKPRIFGLESVKRDELVYVVEGQIDSFFLPNSLAIGGSNYNVSELNTFPNKIFVPDNQPRNPDVVKQIGKVIDAGNTVCIWKENYGKDINEMVVQNNLTQSDLVSMITASSYTGIEAKMMFSKWRKC